ncbi:MAG TPA: DUF5985 family protein [Terriglobales bacterium]|nr:DUF5985 family protein [Terriglobales bacterium]
MASAVYILGAVVSLTCAVLLLRGYFRGKRKLLLWSGLCFLGLALSNFLVFVDLVILKNVDLYPWRLVTTTVAMALLLYGLIWESK